MSDAGSGKRDVPETPGPVVNPELSPAEEVAVVDAGNTLVGSAARAVMRRDGLIHRAVYVLVFNSLGELFVQERTKTKDVFPGFLDLCAGGVVLAGESCEESAARELREELGIEGAGVRFLFDFYGEYQGQRVWGRAYSCVHDGPFALQAEEIAGGSFYPLEALEELTASRPCTPDSIYVLHRHLRASRGEKAPGAGCHE